MKSLKIRDSAFIGTEEKFFTDKKYVIEIVEVQKVHFVSVTDIKTKLRVLIPFSNVVYIQ